MKTLDEIRAMPDATIFIADVAAVMGVDPRTTSGELTVNGGSIPSLRIGRRIVIPRERFLAWFDGLDAASSSPTAEPPEAERLTPTDDLRARLLRVLLDESAGVSA